MNQPEVTERLSWASALTNIANAPPGRPTINDYTFVPERLGTAAYRTDTLPGVAPIPTTEYQTCPATENIEPRGYAAGHEDVMVPFSPGTPKVITLKLPIQEQKLQINRQERRKLERMAKKKIGELPEGSFYGMSFSIFNEPEIRNMAVVKVYSSELEGPNTVNDPRFGIVSGNQACSTCTNTISNCPGHEGYIQLKSPYSPEDFQRTIVRVLNSICLECKRILLDEDTLMRKGLWYWSHPEGHPKRRQVWRFHHEDRLKKIEDLSKGAICYRHIGSTKSHCPPNPEYKYVRDKKRILYRVKGPGNKWEVIRLEQVRAILEQIPPNDVNPANDAELLGFVPPVHPYRMIMKYLPVPPLCTRPPIPLNSQLKQDDITTTYRNIVIHNNKISKLELVTQANANRGPFPAVILPEEEKTRTDREGFVAKMHNEIDKLIFGPKTREERFTSIKKMLQGKEGLPRKFMMGKRGDYSARTVLSPGPELEFGEIGIPKSWASILTYPVEVTWENKEALTELMRAGKVSKIRLKRQEGHQITVNPDNLPDRPLEVGDIIERHMQDGDYVAFNRNPSLHKFSIMGYMIRLVDGLTIHLPIHTTPHHNADYDGDEGNIFLPRSPEAIAELMTVMNSRYCIVSGQDNRPLAGLVFNDLTAAYKLTQEGVIINPKTWQDCMAILNRDGDAPQLVGNPNATPPIPSLEDRLEKYGVKYRSGKALFSALLPRDFYYKKGKVRIIEGIIVRGPVTKSEGGTTHRSIAQFIFKNYNKGGKTIYSGAERAAKFLSDAQFVLKRWLEDEPITTSLADCYPKREPDREVIPIYEITHNPEKIELMDWNLCREIMERHSEYVDFDQLPGRLEKHSIPIRSGEAMISAILPFNLNLQIAGRNVVQDGVLVTEIQSKDQARAIRKEIITKLAVEYDSARVFGFIKDLRTLLVRCLGISVESGKHYEAIHREQERAKAILETYGPKLNDPIEGKRAEQFIATQLDRVRAIGETTLRENLDPANNFTLIVSGAKTKGGPANIGQISAMIGPQFKGAQMASGGTIYQAIGDMDPKGFGVVESNFLKGLGPEEFFHHGDAARVGLVDTSIKTAEPGTLSRQIVKNTEGILVQRDGTVRLQGQQIVQSSYGYTGFNPERLINVMFPEGELPFFVDVKSVIERINGSFGYAPEDAPRED